MAPQSKHAQRNACVAEGQAPYNYQGVEMQCAKQVAVEQGVKAPRQAAARAGKAGNSKQRANGK